MHLCVCSDGRSRCRAAAASSRDEASLQVTRTTQKAVVRIPFRGSGVPAQEVIPGPVGQAGRSSDRHLTVGLDVTRRQRASRAEPEQHAGCPWLRSFAETDSPGAASCRSAAPLTAAGRGRSRGGRCRWLRWARR